MTCDGCTQCCKTLRVDAIAKPANTWCSQCYIGGGCRVYDDRPQPCQAFECLWLLTQRSDTPMPAAMRPDRSKVVIVPTTTRARIASDGTLLKDGPPRAALTLHIDPDRPDAATAQHVRGFVDRMTRGGVMVHLVCADERRVIDVAGSITYRHAEGEAP